MALIGEDCHFFITSVCARGNQCAFRHQPAARATEVTCPDWLNGNCLKLNCGLRHVPVDRTSSRKNVPCFYDNQPSGCLKPNCLFMHVKKASMVTPKTVTQASAVNAEIQLTNPTIYHQPVQQQNSSIILQTKQDRVPKIPPPTAPVHTMEAAIVRPTLVNGVLHFPPRGILGAPPPGIQVVSQPAQPVLVNHNGVPILSSTRLIRPPTIVHASQTQAPIHHTNGNNVYPKSARFDEQVRLFKEMWSTKQNYTHKPKNTKHYYDDDEDDDVQKHKDKQKNLKSKKSKKDKHSGSKGRKKSKDGWMDKADEEVLYNDYKEVPLDKKPKRNKAEVRHAESDSDVNVKSYENILREKALRKLMEKRKEKFNHDFDDIIQSTETINKATKKYSSDGDETVDTKHRKPRRESIDLENEVFSQEDAVELEIEDDEFSAETEKEKHKRRQSKDSRKRKSSKSSNEIQREQKSKSSDTKKRSNTTAASSDKQHRHEKQKSTGESTTKAEKKKSESADLPAPETGVMIIPDETTDINFSVDDDDELALELSNENVEVDKKTHQSKKRSSQNSSAKKVSSVVSFIGKKTEVKTTKTYDNNKEKRSSGASSESSAKPKRKIMVVDSPIDSKKSKDDPDDSQTEKKKVISLSIKKRSAEKMLQKGNDEKETTEKPKSDVKVKTFEEIMAEKRKRKFQDNDVVVVSDIDITSISDSPIKRRSEVVKSKVLTTTRPEKVLTTTRPEKVLTTTRKEKTSTTKSLKEKVSTTSRAQEKKEVDPSLKTAAQLRREKLKQAKEEYEKRRKSQQLYRPKIPAEEKEVSEPPKTTSNVVANAAAEAKKIKLSRVSLANAAAAAKDKVTVRSFQEIMKEKQLRRQTQTNSVRGKIDSKPIQSFLRRASIEMLSKSAANPTKPDATPTTLSVSTTTTTTSTPNAVENGPTNTSSTFDVLALPVKKMVGTAVVTPDRKSQDSPTLPTRPTAPVKLKRFSTSDNDLSPLTERKTSSSEGSVVGDTMKTYSASTEQPSEEQSMEDIKEALDEKKRMREEDMLSDDEFEKEMNDFSSDADDEEDVDDDDFMMELQQMIDS